MRSKCCATGRLERDNVWLEGKRVNELFEGKQHIRVIVSFETDWTYIWGDRLRQGMYILWYFDLCFRESPRVFVLG